MVNTLFGDEIISSTELKNNQKKWFAKATIGPISITNTGGRQYVLFNREHARNLLMAKEYAEKILKFCQEVRDEGDADKFASDVFPWAKNLGADDRRAFRDELVAAFAELVHTNNWLQLDEVVGSWKATAEALTNSKFMEVVNSEPGKREYSEVE